ncbi:zinc finger, CCHC-type, Retrotransposon gag domain protein [Artemisia annua]|uniref:Zinc finger, CCHC-type, Retrotransposon gag domain protein n=1 Tax=Artemisia annua TaxID=35608 RepID=A0A2U1NA83_ARTAN|nr:zinc finger, CCHC-type, Retrotransposon gag domain protein [Artemisia annua]
MTELGVRWRMTILEGLVQHGVWFATHRRAALSPDTCFSFGHVFRVGIEMANTRRSNLNQPRIQRDGEEASVTAPNENEAPNVVARPVQRLPRAPSQRNEYDEGHENRRREDDAENDFDHYEDSLENHTRRCNNRVGSTFETFMKCKPPTFKGSTDPQVYFQWFLKMDQTFDSGVFTEAQRVSYAIWTLEGSALQWWNSVSRTLSANARASLTWEACSNKVKTKYCSRGAIQRIERDFLNLKKGNMNIDQYNTAFTEKLKFANKLCPDEESKVARYVEGLPYEYRTSVQSRTTLEAAMEESKFIEDDIAIKNQELGKVGENRKSEGHTASSKMFKGNSNNKKYDNNNEETKCVECNSRHTGECTLETRRCFRCGKKGHVGQDCTSKEPICYSCKEMGHISTNCPNKKVGNTGGTNTRKDVLPSPKACAFHMTAEEEKENKETGEADETYAMYANRA